ncbi:hypothetical protein [Streptomyces gilvus]|uniref:hypothetical protein n=1 Tax=Streptomyces gilvus TaxID=2920937 RepID=UPI001F0F071D|nr:hypothetical protein [Streptomyces sp. CME 23]MCH5677271.1 hypothetical protein [Streptomyces sp. CME 23]
MIGLNTLELDGTPFSAYRKIYPGNAFRIDDERSVVVEGRHTGLWLGPAVYGADAPERDQHSPADDAPHGPDARFPRPPRRPALRGGWCVYTFSAVFSSSW